MSANKRTKRLAALDAPLVLTSKRKRTTVSYAEVEGDPDPMSDDEDPKPVEETTMADSDEDEDEDFSVSRKKTTKAPPKKKIKKSSQPKKPKKFKPFRFLDLPPELRDMIYEMALVDPNDVSIVARTRAYRQKPLRGPVYGEDDYRSAGWRRSRRLKSGAAQVSPLSTTFLPALLAVNKQINAEAINYLYGHEFIFENCTALTEFLFAIGHRNQQRLATVKIVSWGSHSSASRVANGNGLTIVAGATNLKALILDCMISGGNPNNMAQQLYRDGHHFIGAYGAANGSKDAAVDILELHDKNYPVYNKNSEEQQKQSFEKQLRVFANLL